MGNQTITITKSKNVNVHVVSTTHTTRPSVLRRFKGLLEQTQLVCLNYTHCWFSLSNFLFQLPEFSIEKDGSKVYSNQISLIERYFVVNKLSEKNKLDFTVLCLEGEALERHQWEDAGTMIMTFWHSSKASIPWGQGWDPPHEDLYYHLQY